MKVYCRGRWCSLSATIAPLHPPASSSVDASQSIRHPQPGLDVYSLCCGLRQICASSSNSTRLILAETKSMNAVQYRLPLAPRAAASLALRSKVSTRRSRPPLL